MAGEGRKSGLGLKLAIVAVVIAGAAFWALAAARPQVRVATVTRGDIVDLVSGSVEVWATKAQPVESEVEGRLMESNLEEGRRVSTGDVLAQIDRAPTQSRYDSNQAQLDALRLQKAIADRDDYVLKLQLRDAQQAWDAEKNMGANAKPLELARLETDVHRIQDQIEQEAVDREKNIRQYEITAADLERSLAATTIRANYDGVITDVKAHVGALLSPRTPLATLISLDRNIDALINQENLARIREGQEATVRFAGTNTPYELEVASILPTADPETQLYTVRLTTAGVPPELLIHGLHGEVLIAVGEHKDVTVVPHLAVKFGQVFVVNGGRVEQRTVGMGYSNLEQAEITDGLEPGDTVVVEGLDAIRDGQRVKVIGEEAPR